MTLIELRYITIQEKDEQSADYLIGLFKSWPVSIVYPDEKQSLLAARFKSARQLSLADSIVAAAAFHLEACLVHKDPEFDALSADLRLESLPYKHKSAGTR